MSLPSDRLENLPRLADLAQDAELRAVLVTHATRGIRIQLLLRTVLAIFTLLTVLLVPPLNDAALCRAIAVGYLIVAIGVGVAITRPTLRMVRYIWLALFLDILVLATIAVIAGRSQQSWTEDVLLNGFFLIPVLAATQLRPWLCAVIAGPTVLIYLGSALAAQEANLEPLTSVLLRTVALSGVAAACILLTRVQRSRVLTIGALVEDRSTLSGELLQVQAREQRILSETLHDGALQYLLSARQDLADARDTGDAESFERVERALTESSRLLRSTVSSLHPAVLDRAGLLPALRDLADDAARRGGFRIDWSIRHWPETLRTTADPLLWDSARELLTNVAVHARARTVVIDLDRDESTAVLTITDDGVGIPEGELDRKLGAGHVGLAARRVRIEAAGGRFTLQPSSPTGTCACVTVPALPR